MSVISSSTKTWISSLKITITDLLLATFCSAIVIRAFQNDDVRIGDAIWVFVLAIVIFFVCRQIVDLINRNELPFDQSQLGTRIRWISIRAIGVIALAMLITDSSSTVAEYFTSGLDESEVSCAYTINIFVFLVNAIIPLGCLLSIVPLYRIRKIHSNWIWATIANSACWFIATTILILGTLDTQMVTGLIHIACTGIELGMLKPVEVYTSTETFRVPNLELNQHQFTAIARQCAIAAAIAFVALLLASRFLKIRRLLFGIWAIAIGVAVYFLAQMYTNQLPQLTGFWSSAVVLPTQSGIITVVISCLFAGFFTLHILSSSCNGFERQLLDQKKLGRFDLPAVLQLILLAGFFIELYLLYDYSTYFLFDLFSLFSSSKTSVTNWFTHLEIAPSSPSIIFGVVPIGTISMAWFLVLGLTLFHVIQNRFWNFEDEKCLFESINVSVWQACVFVPIIALTYMVVALAFGNYGFASVIDTDTHLMDVYCWADHDSIPRFVSPLFALLSFGIVAGLVWIGLRKHKASKQDDLANRGQENLNESD